MKSTTCTDGLVRVACETLIRSTIWRLATDGSEATDVVSAHTSHGLQGVGSEVNTTHTRLELRAVIEGLKSISAGSEW